VFRVSRLLEMRQPTDADCRLPAQTPRVAANLPSDLPTADGTAALTPEVTDTPLPPPEPEQQLTAYFGAWLAKCEQLGTSFGCVLSVELEGDSVSDAGPPVLKITRRSEQQTDIDLEFPGQEIEGFEQIRWSVDEFDVGIIGQSQIRVDEIAARQQIRGRQLIQQDLLPRLIDGVTVVIEVDQETDVEKFIGTLIGLTRALAFADSFTASNGRI